MIEIQILDPQLQTLTDPHARSITEAGRTNDARLPEKPRMRTTSSGVSTTGKRPDGRGLPDLLKPGQIRCTAPCRRRTAGRQCLTMRGDRNLALVRQPGQKCLDFAAAQGCR